MQKIGDVCDGCRERWELRKREPKVLQAGRDTTMQKATRLPLCEYCDGDAVRVAQLSDDQRG